MTRTTLVVTVAFLVTQLPFYVVEILNAVKAEQLRAEAAATNFTDARQSPVININPAEIHVYIWLNAISKMLAFVSCCINPIIYGLLNYNYSQFFVLFVAYTTVLCRHTPHAALVLFTYCTLILFRSPVTPFGGKAVCHP